VGLIVVAAIAAFASTGNAGIMSASRYPLAMARDRLVSDRFATLGRFRTPTFAIVVTAVLMAAAIVLLDVASIAKLASAFQLLLFSLLSLAVVIMRESGIEGYDPGYRSPLYPWMQIFGFLSPLWLIAEMGEMAILFTLGLVAVTIGWYFHYGRARVQRTGAIFHTFARLGTLRHTGLDQELRTIVREKGLREQDPWERVITQAQVLECEAPVDLAALARMAADRLAVPVGRPPEVLQAAFLSGMEAGYMPVSHGAALPHIRLEGIGEPLILLVRCSAGVEAPDRLEPGLHDSLAGVRAVFFLVSPDDDAGQHLRLLGHLATRVDDPDFLGRWMAARNPSELRTSLLREERWLSLSVGETPATEGWAGEPLRAIRLPAGTLVALIRRDGHGIIPGGGTILQSEDELVIIGESEALAALRPVEGAPLAAERP
jgi:APA family basic amino acid/polyamine antiporter